MILLDSVILSIQDQVNKLGRGKVFTKEELGLSPDFNLSEDIFMLMDWENRGDLIKVDEDLYVDFSGSNNRVVATLQIERVAKSELAWLNTQLFLSTAQSLRAQALRNELKHLLRHP